MKGVAVDYKRAMELIGQLERTTELELGHSLVLMGTHPTYGSIAIMVSCVGVCAFFGESVSE
jgi:hypothetical protein